MHGEIPFFFFPEKNESISPLRKRYSRKVTCGHGQVLGTVRVWMSKGLEEGVSVEIGLKHREESERVVLARGPSWNADQDNGGHCFLSGAVSLDSNLQIYVELTFHGQEKALEAPEVLTVGLGGGRYAKERPALDISRDVVDANRNHGVFRLSASPSTCIHLGDPMRACFDGSLSDVPAFCANRAACGPNRGEKKGRMSANRSTEGISLGLDRAVCALCVALRGAAKTGLIMQEVPAQVRHAFHQSQTALADRMQNAREELKEETERSGRNALLRDLQKTASSLLSQYQKDSVPQELTRIARAIVRSCTNVLTATRYLLVPSK